jgi:hypothetical protein
VLSQLGLRGERGAGRDPWHRRREAEGREPQELKEVATLGQKSNEEVSKFLGIEPR